MPSRKPRILVVEDEPLIALFVKELLDDLNCECVGPIKDLPTAVHSARNGSFDAAILAAQKIRRRWGVPLPTPP